MSTKLTVPEMQGKPKINERIYPTLFIWYEGQAYEGQAYEEQTA
jgi:hypothetical protein